MRRTIWIALLFSALTVVCLPADVAAQHRRAVRASRPVVVAGGYYYRPYFYRPYFYSPYFYNPFYWGFYTWYPYPYGPFPPYGYYPRFYTDASSVRIQVTPREAEVYLDGYYVGRVDDFDGFSQRLTIPPGEHQVDVFLDGYRTIREKRLFLPRKTYHIKQVMERAAEGEPPAARPMPKEEPGRPGPGEREWREQPYGTERPGARSEFGTLTLRAQPADATVRVDGHMWERPEGDEPLVIDLAEGTHTLEVQKEGFRPFTREFQVRRGETTTVNVSLPEL